MFLSPLRPELVRPVIKQPSPVSNSGDTNLGNNSIHGHLLHQQQQVHLTVPTSHQPSPRILQKALTNSPMSTSVQQPQDLSRFRSYEHVGFTAVTNGGHRDSGNTLVAHNITDAREGLLLRANNGHHQLHLHPNDVEETYITVSSGPHDSLVEVKDEKADVMTGITSAADSVGNANSHMYSGIIGHSSKPDSHTSPRLITTSNAGPYLSNSNDLKNEGSKDSSWQELKPTSQQQLDQPIYQWNQLVPLITAPVSPPKVFKTEASEEKPLHINGEEPLVNGNSSLKQSPCSNSRDGLHATSSCYEGQGVVSSPSRDGFDPADGASVGTDADDDVFLTDSETSSGGMDGQKRRTQSFGGSSIKDEPKSPRKVR